MTSARDQLDRPLWRHTGSGILSAAEAALKAALECLPSIQRVIYVTSQATVGLDRLMDDPDTVELLRMHRLRVDPMNDAARAMLVASWAARQGQHVLALLTGPTVPAALDLLESTSRIGTGGGALGLLVEDLGLNDQAVDIRGRLSRIGVPVLEARDVPHLRDSVENVLRISRSDLGVAAMVVDRIILRCSETIPLRPNREEQEEADDPLRQRRRKRPRWDETGGALRMTRRLELNNWRAMPSPGEAVATGFITVGPADRTLRHLAGLLGITGKLPVLHLGVLHPLDDAAVGRLLSRCRHVVVLEPRPGTVEHQVRRVAEQVRLRGKPVAQVWGREIPPDGEADRHHLTHAEVLQPSALMRRLMHLLRPIVSASRLEFKLVPEPAPLPVTVTTDRFGSAGQHEAVRRVARSLPELLESDVSDAFDEADAAEPEERVTPEERPVRLFIDGQPSGPADGRPVYLETFAGPAFARQGPSAVRQAAESRETWVLLVAQPHGPGRPDLERLAQASVPVGAVDSVEIRRGTLAETSRLRRMMREAVQARGLVVIIIDDGPPSRFDVGAIESELADIDRVGFQPVQRIIWPADRAAVIRQPPMLAELEVEAVRHAAALETRTSREDLAWRWPPRLGGRIRLLVEQVEVHRSRAPVRERRQASGGLPLPVPVHGDAASWSIHLAGLRGRSPGLVAEALMLAGSTMGYHVQSRLMPMPIGAGRRAWAQVTFSRPRTADEAGAVSPVVPWGEADVLLGLDRTESLLAISPTQPLRVASPERTFGVINIGLFEDQRDREVASQNVAAISDHFRNVLQPEGQVIEDFSDLCRWRFFNERLADLAQLGTAFQRGVIPVTVDAMESALRMLEGRGNARLLEAFGLGRAFAETPAGLRRPREDPNAETAEQFVRRQGLQIGRAGLGSREKANRFRRLCQRAMYDLRGLDDTEEGRDAYRDFTVALRRCITWGGFDYAERFADDVFAVFRADRADTGYALTCKAILPLAEASLIRDSIFLASMVISSEHRRLTRHRLNVHRARGDRLEVRYLTRLEATLARWRFRMDLRTSDWMVRVLSSLRHLLPPPWRGTRRDRLVRRLVRDIALRSQSGAEDDYDHWLGVLTELNRMALDGRLRRINPERLRVLLRRSRDDD